jgi:predicted nucleotidyltransferase
MAVKKETKLIGEDQIKEVKRKLIEAYSPEIKEIYLFGSYAWGSPDEHSDLDIIVVVKDSDVKSFKRGLKGMRALRGMGIAKDIVVYTEEEFKDLANDKTTLCYKAVTEGEKLYEH